MAIEDNPIYRLLKVVEDGKECPVEVLDKAESRSFQSTLAEANFCEILDYVNSIKDKDPVLASFCAGLSKFCADPDNNISGTLYEKIKSIDATLLRNILERKEALFKQHITRKDLEDRKTKYGFELGKVKMEVDKHIVEHGGVEEYLAYLISEKERLAQKGATVDLAKSEMRLADLYLSVNRLDKSLALFQMAQNSFDSSGMEIESAICRIRMSDVYHKMREYLHASVELFKASDVFEKLGMGIEYVLCNWRWALISLDDKPDSNFLNQLLSTKSAFVQNRLVREIAECDLVIAEIYKTDETYLESLKHFQSARKGFEEENLDEYVAKCECGVGDIESVGGNHEIGLTLLDSARQRFKRFGKQFEVAKCSGKIGIVYKRMGLFQKALAEFQSAELIYHSTGRKKEMAECDVEISNIYQLLGNFNAAISYLRGARETFGELDMSYEAARCGLRMKNMQKSELTQLQGEMDSVFSKRSRAKQEMPKGRTAWNEMEIGKLYEKYGFLEEALFHYKLGLSRLGEDGLLSRKYECEFMIRNAEEKQDEVSKHVYATMRLEKHVRKLGSLLKEDAGWGRNVQIANYELRIGNSYKKVSLYGKALEHYEYAKKYFEKGKMEIEGAGCDLEIGIMYEELGEEELALKHLKDAKRSFEDKGRKLDAAKCDTNIGNVVKRNGNLDAVLSLYKSALDVFRNQKGMQDWEGRIEGNMALVLMELKRYEEAVNLLRAARERLEGYGLNEEVAQCDLILAIVRREGGQNEEAIRLFKQVYERFNHIPDHKFRSLWGMARSEKLLGRYESAKRHLAESIETIEDMRALILENQYRSSFLESVHEAYRDMIELCVSEKDYEGALEYIERLKSRNLSEMLAGRELRPKNVSEEQRNEYNSIRMRLKQLLDKENGREGEVQVSDLDMGNDAEELTRQYTTLINAVREMDPEFDPGGRVRISYTEIKNLAAEANSVILELFPSKDKTIVLLVDSNKESEVTGLVIEDYNGKDLKAHIEKLSRHYEVWQKSIGFQKQEENRKQWESSLDGILKETYIKIFMKVKPYIKEGRKIIMIPYGGFHLLPLHAMYTEEGSQRRYLIDDYMMVYAPSAKILKLCKARDRVQRDKVAVVMASPEGRRKLVFSRDEAQEIMNLFTDSRVVWNATKEDVIAQGKECNILHFSGHAHFKGLILHGKEGNSAEEELSIEDIFVGLDLPKTTLATLSACETGRILSVKNVDEYIGLPSGLLHAGATTVVSSLWCVEDYSTSLLMRKMYRFVKEGMGKAEALVEAQRWIKDPENKGEHLKGLGLEQAQIGDDHNFDFTRPYHWAGFICSGVN